MAFKLNNVNDYEPLCSVKLTKEKFPKAYAAKVEELIEEGMCETKEEAESMIKDMEIELELYYEKGHGLFAVESEAVDSGTIFSPYSGEEGEAADE